MGWCVVVWCGMDCYRLLVWVPCLPTATYYCHDERGGGDVLFTFIIGLLLCTRDF